MRRQRQTALDYDRAALDAVSDHPPVPVRSGNDLVWQETGEVLATIEHRYGFVEAVQRFEAAWRARQ